MGEERPVTLYAKASLGFLGFALARADEVPLRESHTGHSVNLLLSQSIAVQVCAEARGLLESLRISEANGDKISS